MSALSLVSGAQRERCVYSQETTRHRWRHTTTGRFRFLKLHNAYTIISLHFAAVILDAKQLTTRQSTITETWLCLGL